MNVLSRFLYLFQCLPVFLPKSIFRKIDTLISSFVWQGKTPRIRKELLQRHRSTGGLVLPNIRHYYWAANIHKIIVWTKEPTLNWCELEAKSCPNTSLLALLTSTLPSRPTQYSNNPIVVSNQIKSSFHPKNMVPNLEVLMDFMDPLFIVPFATTISFSPLTLMGPSICGRD